MKNTQKKLKAKHFRYLSKENINEPMSYLEDFYGSATDLAPWLDSLNTLINASFCAKMKSVHAQPNGNNCKRLITQIEFAYLIFHRCNLKKIKGELNFQPVDYRTLSHRSAENKHIAENWINETLVLFFSCQNLKDWHKTLDRFLINIVDMECIIQDYKSIGENRLLIIRELLSRLAFALHLIYENGEIPVRKTNTTGASKKEKKMNAKDGADVSILSSISPKKRDVELPKWLDLHPYSAETLKAFFDKNDLNGWRDDIRYWYETVLTEDQYWDASINQNYSGANLLYIYSCIKSFVEIFLDQLPEDERLDLSVQYNNPASIFPKTASLNIQQNGRYRTLYYVKYEDKENPLQVILESLSIFSMLEWQEILYDWLQCGLSSNSYVGAYAPFTGTIYQTITKVLELSYLIAFKDEIEFIDTTPLQNTKM